MKRVLGCIRKAATDFNMIQDGDKVACAVSGGKDSLLMLRALAAYKQFSKEKFDLCAITVDMGLEPFDVTIIQNVCDEYNVPYYIKKTDIGKVVFDTRKETNPCSLCANMRRGAVNKKAKEMGCNKIALGHHADDATETLLMSLLYEGRIHTFSPVTYLSRSDITVIRPLIYLEEDYIIKLTSKYSLPIITSPCPACGNTKRAEIKDLISELSVKFPDIRQKLLGALMNSEQYGLWDKIHKSNN